MKEGRVQAEINLQVTVCIKKGIYPSYFKLLQRWIPSIAALKPLELFMV